ncbi:winged helix-turn-helix transcriptional regulator [Paenibacillus eucommiae]|uniref:DNA-binding HxlR family transcriptional regulator n=1 Tax=Paenibacillus eucommiae TaxID=1355755 RepID=A0ABS4J6Y4_9BACL|nr:helix-turn-helix domain-containing protein [Paenibacillus eucommiae]MBP1995617.1 DNA-binding HxlR family transcriptional regulator [Paenibacillus eucommiae]
MEANNYIPRLPAQVDCSIDPAINVLSGKWSFLVIRELYRGTKRFGELQRNIDDVSARALSGALKHLEKNGILERQVFPTVPATVEYTLTPKGQDLYQITKMMKVWAAKWT